MSHFTTECHYTTATLWHKMSFRNTHPLPTGSRQGRRPTTPDLPRSCCDPYQAPRSSLYLFSLSLKAHTTVEKQPSSLLPRPGLLRNLLLKGQRGARFQLKGEESALGLPCPERRPVNVVVGWVCDGMWPQGHVWGTANAGSVARNCSPETLGFHSVRATV